MYVLKSAFFVNIQLSSKSLFCYKQNENFKQNEPSKNSFGQFYMVLETLRGT